MEPYFLNQWLIKPNLCELIDESVEIKLQIEPQLMALLCFLVKNKNEVVSRDELASAVWGDTAIEDNTISKAITRLRKVLNDSARQPSFIKTIPKKGYLLIAKVSSVRDSLIDEKSDKMPEKRHLSPYYFYILSAVFIIPIVGHFVARTELNKDHVFDSRPITSMTGEEYHASYSPNTNDLVFVAFHKDRPWLFLQSQKETLPKPILELNDAQAQLHWSPISNSILYAEQTNDLCQVVLIEDILVSLPKKRLVFECEQKKKLNPVWDIDGQGFYYISESSDDGLTKANYYDFVTQENKLIQQPEFSTDIAYVSVSKNGKYLGFLYHKLTNSSNVLIFEKNSLRKVASINLDYLISEFDWNNDSTAIVHTSEHPSHRIIEHSFSGVARNIATSQMGYLQDVKAIGNSRDYVVTSRYIDRDLILAGELRSEKAIDSAYPDYNGVYSNQGDVIAFASKRSGRAQIWLAKKNGQMEQLSDFKHAFYIYDIAWSKNDNLLLVRTSDSIVVFDISSGKTQKFSIELDGMKSLNWLDEFHFSYVARSITEGDKIGSGLYTMDISNRQSERLKDHVNQAYYDSVEGQWYYSFEGGNQIFKTNDLNIQGQVSYQSMPNTLLKEWKYRHTTLGVVEIKESEQLEELILISDNKRNSITKRRRIGFFDIVSPNKVLLTQVTSNESNIVKLIEQ